MIGGQIVPIHAMAQQLLLSFFSFFFAWRRLTCQSIIANRKRLSNPDRQRKQTTGDRRVHSTSCDRGSCFAMA